MTSKAVARPAPDVAPWLAAESELVAIDALRFVASCGIVLCHSAEFLVPRAFRPESHAQTAGLSLFVDVFFVISGFIIAHFYAGRVGTLAGAGDFLKKRIARLWPLHLLTLSAMTLFWLAVRKAGLHAETFPSLSPACLASAAVLTHGWFDCGGLPPNGVSWSISAEMAAYLAFPLAVRLLAWPRALRWLAFALVLSACGAAAGGFRELTLTFSALRAFPPFLFGMLLFAERNSLARLRLPHWCWPALAAALVLMAFAQVDRPIIAVLAYLTPMAAIAADLGAPPARTAPLLARLGQLTYSLYMLHSIVITVLLNALCDKLLKLSQPVMIAATGLTWGAILVLSYFSYRWLEMPARRYINGITFSASKACTS